MTSNCTMAPLQKAILCKEQREQGHGNTIMYSMVRERQTLMYSWWQDMWQEINPGLRLCVPWGGEAFGIYPRGNQESENPSCSVVSDSLRSHGLYSPWNSPGHNTGVGSLSLLQGIFPNQGLNPGLLHCRRILYQLSHKRSPRILEWVAYPFSKGSFQLKNQTGFSCIACRFLPAELPGKPILSLGLI